MKSAHSKAKPVLWISLAASLLAVAVAIIWVATNSSSDRIVKNDASRPAASTVQPAPSEVRAETPVESSAPRIPLAKVPSFGKPAKVSGVRSTESPRELVQASIGKSAHLYKPAPPLEVERKQAEASLDPTEDTVKIVTGFECSTPLEIEKISPTHFAIKITTDSTLRNWFMFRVEGAKGKTVRIDIKDAPLNKWWSLNPVWSDLASIDDPATFHKVTSDKKYPAMQAYNGPLLPDTSAQNWHYISDVWSTDQQPDKTGTYCFVRTYDTDGEYLAMRPPYTPKYNEAYLKSLEGRPGVKVIEVGNSKENRPLHIVQIGTGDPKKVPCVFIYAREHGSEHDSSWPVQGAIDWLLSDDREARLMREGMTLIAIPMLDVDAAAQSKYEVITQKFVYDGREGPEAQAYAGFFRNWIDLGNRLDMTLDLHNVESGEGPHVYCPILEYDDDRYAMGHQYHQLLTINLKSRQYSFFDKALGRQTSWFRLGGYLGYMYGPLFLPYEINSQDKLRHLTTAELSKLGQVFASTASSYLTGENSAALEKNIMAVRAIRTARVISHGEVFTSRGIENALQIEWGCRNLARKASKDAILLKDAKAPN